MITIETEGSALTHLLPCLQRIARFQNAVIDPLEMREALNSINPTLVSKRGLKAALNTFARSLGLPKPKWSTQVDPANMPLLLVSEAQGLAVLRGQNAQGHWIVEAWDEESEQWLENSNFVLSGAHFVQVKLARPFKASNSPVYAAISNEIFSHKRVLTETVLAGIIINTVALATAFYTMQVYDRVIPTGAINTLLVLALGAFAAVLYELLAKHTRHKLYNRLVDVVDQRLARTTFMRFLTVRLDQLPPSVGSLAAQMRGYETVRNFLTVATSHLFVDAPFALVYVAIIFLIAGPIAAVPLIFFVVCVCVGLYYRKRVDNLAKNMDAAQNLKTGLLVEAVEGAETIKSGQGGWRMLSQWMSTTDNARAQELQMRDISEYSKNLVASVQQFAYLGIITLGAVLASSGELTLGALIACSILSGRVLAPVAAVPTLLVQWAHTKAALQGLDHLWSLEDDHHGQEQPIILDNIEGGYRFEDVAALYGNRAALTVPKLRIKPGEKVAILGPIGAGKTTLLRLLSGMYRPQQGRILLDDVDLSHISKPVLADHLGFVQQDGRLFSGTLRDNLTLGLLDPGDDMLLDTARKTGLLQSVISSHPEGLQQVINEGGTGLSGGQRQLVNLTRAFLRQPNIWLLDEPTASMDRSLEQLIIGALRAAMRPTDTLFLVTHKPELLSLVDRIIVVANQKIVLDGPKDAVLQQLSANQGEKQQPAAQSVASAQSPQPGMAPGNKSEPPGEQTDGKHKEADNGKVNEEVNGGDNVA